MRDPKHPSRARELEAVILLALVCLVVGFITHRQAFFFGALALLATALFIPPLARAIARAWLHAATMIGTVNNAVILMLVFYLLLAPIALLYRRFTRNPLTLEREDLAPSFYRERNHAYTKADLEKMW